MSHIITRNNNSGGGDVVGPNSSIDGDIAIFDGTTGKIIADSGILASQILTSACLITLYASNGSWSIDPRTKLVEIYAWGAGAGGGSGRSGASGAAGGGSGGGCGYLVYQRILRSLLTSSPYAITIGQGGTGGASVNTALTDGNPGIAGGNTTVGSILIAPGGNRGNGGINGSAVAGLGAYFPPFQNGIVNGAGAGSLTNGGSVASFTCAWATSGGGGAGYIASTPHTGGGGGNINTPANAVLLLGGLAGSNVGGNGGDGNSPTGLQLMLGGTGGGGGGHDGNTTSGSGGNGAFPSGGGGGGAGNLSGNASGAGGNGANGQVIIIEYF